MLQNVSAETTTNVFFVGDERASVFSVCMRACAAPCALRQLIGRQQGLVGSSSAMCAPPNAKNIPQNDGQQAAESREVGGKKAA